MHRFFASRDNISETEIIIDNDDVLHIKKVLRLDVGDDISVCDGMGNDYKCRITQIESKRVICSIEERLRANTEANIRVTLFQGIPKGTKMDYIIQKTTELGVTRIVPCMFSRCVVRLENEKAEKKKVERWQKIAEEAAKQSGRGIIPEVTMPVDFKTAVEMLKENDIYFAPYECEEQNILRDKLLEKTDVKTVGFMIGPEGGYDLKETDELAGNGVDTVTLGRRILRTETAGEAVLSMIMYEIGDINKF